MPVPGPVRDAVDDPSTLADGPDLPVARHHPPVPAPAAAPPLVHRCTPPAYPPTYPRAQAGVPTVVPTDGTRAPSPALDLIARLNALGRRYAAGRGVHLGDTILGAKGRIVFEAPAALALIAAHAELEKLVLTKEQRQLKVQVAEAYGRLLHEGLAFDPAAADAAGYLRASQARVTGQARLRFTPGTFDVIGVRSPHSLMRSSVVLYGEANAYLSPEESKGVGKTLALPGILASFARGRTR